jgi:Rhodopirellula transposase DDE domain
MPRSLVEKLGRVWPHLNERGRRMVAAAAALEYGDGGVAAVSRACGRSRVTITQGIREWDEAPLPEGRVRRAGGGRTPVVERDRALVGVLDSLVEPWARGDPESPLRWTGKSTRTLAQELPDRRHPISHEKGAQLLRGLDYRLPGTRKTEEGTAQPDRDAQFRHINRTVRQALRQGWPVISVDTKKKELLGNVANAGRQWRRTKTAARVNTHDFPAPSVPRAYP